MEHRVDTLPAVIIKHNSSWFDVVKSSTQHTIGCSISRQFSQLAATPCRISIVQFLMSSVYCQSVIFSCTSLSQLI